jgi:WD40 repeat protein
MIALTYSERIMSASTRRAIVFVVGSLLVTAGGLYCLQWWFFLTGLFARKPGPLYDAPSPLASISVPHRPSALAWSPDGASLAAGSWGWGSGEEGATPSEVYVVDVATSSAATTRKVSGALMALAFSPDGKWLAVGTAVNSYSTSPAVLLVLDVPGFTVRHTVKADTQKDGGFLDLAWAPDSKALAATDGTELGGKTAVRRWSVPGFAEKEAIRAAETERFGALALSPGGRVLAVAAGPNLIAGKGVIRLFDGEKGTEHSPSPLATVSESSALRLGYTPDGKVVGVFDGKRTSWWDVGTGRTASPDPARFAVQPAGRSSEGRRQAVAPGGAWMATGLERHRGLGDLGWDNRDNDFGSFVSVTSRATGKDWTWRVGDRQGTTAEPALAFSPDGTRLAGAVERASTGQAGTMESWILIWPLPE